MKKTLAHPADPAATLAAPRRLWTRLVGGMTLLVLLASVGLFASRPAHTAGGPVPVTVTNSPLATADVDDPDQQPFQITLSPHSSSASSSTDDYVAPLGKRVVIDYYSAQLTQYPSGGYGYLYLSTIVNGHQAFYKVVPPVASTTLYNQMTRIYSDPGTLIQALVVQSSGTSSGGIVILSGHTVNVR